MYRDARSLSGDVDTVWLYVPGLSKLITNFKCQANMVISLIIFQFSFRDCNISLKCFSDKKKNWRLLKEKLIWIRKSLLKKYMSISKF